VDERSAKNGEIVSGCRRSGPAFSRLDRLLPIGSHAEGARWYPYANLHCLSKLFF